MKKKIIPKKRRRWLGLNLKSRDAIKKKNTKPCIKKITIIRIMTKFDIKIKKKIKYSGKNQMKLNVQGKIKWN